MTDRELMQQALDAMLNFPNDISDEMFESIRVLRARLAEPEQKHSEQWWRHEVSNAWAEGYEKGRASVKQPEQEPVAWITGGGKGELWWHQSVKFDDDGNLIGENPDDIPLYTVPPQREWQGLTPEEAREISLANRPYVVDMVAALEAKLKEKNT